MAWFSILLILTTSCLLPVTVLAPPPEATPAPTEATPAPTEATPAPTEATPAPTEATPAPTEATPAPTEATPAPTEATPAPAEATPAPTEATPAPTEATPAPTEATPAPTEATPAPTEATPAPTEATPAPAEATPAPTEATPAPTEATPAPAEATPAPTEATPAPTEATPAPTEATPAPTEATPAPTEATPAPTEATPAPTEATPAPTEATPAPTEATPAPTEADCEDPGYCIKWNPDKCICECPGKKEIMDKPTKFLLCPFYMIAHLKDTCYEMPCAKTTVWEQSRCRCLVPTSTEKIAASKSKIGTCTLTIDYRYSPTDSSFVDFKKNHLHMEKYRSKIHVDDVKGATSFGKAAKFDGMSLEMPILKYNELGNTILLKVRVKPESTPRNFTQVILSNGCYSKGGFRNKDPASIDISYQQSTNEFQIVVKTLLDQSGSCDIPADADGWYAISVSVKASKTKVMINDQLCTEFAGDGPISKNSCPLTIGGDPLASNNNLDFYGYLDYIRLYKYCHKEPTP